MAGQVETPPKIALVGDIAASWLPRLQSLMRAACDWLPIGEHDPALLEVLASADVAISYRYPKEWATVSRRLRLLQLHSSGYEKVDFEALPPGCAVAHVLGHEPAMAEFVILQMLALSRKLASRDRAMRDCSWERDGTDDELGSKTVGILGFGSLGRAIAKLAHAFSMSVIGIKRTPIAGLAREYGLDFLGGPDDLPRMLRDADFLVVTTPLDEHTRGLVGAEQLGLLKRSAFVINVARGPVVDEEALYDALVNRTIAGAAIDVWYAYPPDFPEAGGRIAPSRFPIHTLENVLMSPHVSGRTSGTFRRRQESVAANVERFLRGEPLSLQIWPPSEALPAARGAGQ